MYTYLLIIIFLAVLLMKSGPNKNEEVVENWANYKTPPYNYVDTGRDPLHFYRRDRYRKPYRYPYKFYQSYPYPHYTYNP